MNVLYIWEGCRPLPEERKQNIRLALDRYPQAKFFCITREKEFFDPRFNIVSWDETLRNIEDFFGVRDDISKFDNYINFSDWARFYFLVNNPDTLYMDTDVTLAKEYDFENEEKFLKPIREICLLYAPKNGAAENMIPILRKKLERRATYRILMNIGRRMNGNWYSDISRDYFWHWR